MNAVGLIILTLANAGYWFGGDIVTVGVNWRMHPPMPPVRVVWELRYGSTTVANGQWLPGEERTLKAPSVRVRTPLTFAWEVYRAGENGELIEAGRAPVHVFPSDLLEPLPRLVKDQPVYVLERGGGLPELLRSFGLKVHSVKRSDDLAFVSEGLLIVEAYQLESHELWRRTTVADAAGRGMRVLVLNQGWRGEFEISGMPLVSRNGPEAFLWRRPHPIVNGLNDEDLASWGAPGTRAAIRLSAEEPALELAWWPRDPADDGPLDAAAVTKTLGRGRIVLWQIPLGPWERDPRSQILLVNAVDYLLSPVQPTPPRITREPKAPKEGQQP